MKDPDIFGDLKEGRGDPEIFKDLPEDTRPETRTVPVAPQKKELTYGDRMKGAGMELLRGFARGGPMGVAVAGVGEATKSIDEGVDIAAAESGGLVTDVTGSPEAGYATNVGIRAAPMLLSGQLAKKAGETFRDMGRGLMQSALKPDYASLKTGKAATAIETMLKDGVPVTEGGLNRMLKEVDKLDDEVSKMVASSSETVSKGDVGLRLKETFEKFKKQVNPQADLEDIKKAWVAFRDHPLLAGKTDIPVKLAQEMKQGTYQALKSKAYGEVKGADQEAQKALARGLKETIAEKIPGVSEKNARQSDLLNAAELLERRVLMDPNKALLGLTPLGPNPISWMLFMADRMRSEDVV